MSMNFSCDNIGNRIPPHPNVAAPKLASGAQIVCATAGTNYTATVVAGASYKITCFNNTPNNGNIYMCSVSGTIVTAVNREWVTNIGESIVIHIPNDKTTLNIGTTINTSVIYLTRLEV